MSGSGRRAHCGLGEEMWRQAFLKSPHAPGAPHPACAHRWPGRRSTQAGCRHLSWQQFAERDWTVRPAAPPSVVPGPQSLVQRRGRGGQGELERVQQPVFTPHTLCAAAAPAAFAPAHPWSGRARSASSPARAAGSGQPPMQHPLTSAPLRQLQVQMKGVAERRWAAQGGWAAQARLRCRLEAEHPRSEHPPGSSAGSANASSSTSATRMVSSVPAMRAVEQERA